MTDSQKAYLFGVITVLFWSTVATAFKLALQYLDIFQLLFYACCTSVVVLAVAVVASGRFNELRGYGVAQYRRSVIAGVLNPFVYYLVLFQAYDLLPAQVAQPINYTWAITLTILSILILKQRITGTDIGAALICYAGVLVIATQGDLGSLESANLAGVGLALFSTVIWASYWIYNIRDDRDPIIALFLNFLFALPLTLVAALVFSDLTIDSINGLLGAIYVGVFEMGLAFLTWSMALKLAPNTSRVSNLIFISPFLSLWFIHTFLGEEIHLTTYLGLVLIVSGLLWQRLGQR